MKRKRWWWMIVLFMVVTVMPVSAVAQDYDEDGDRGDACGVPPEPRLAGQYPTSEVVVAPPLCLEQYPLVTPGGHCRSAAYDIFSSVGQEENNADTNVLLSGVSSYVAPTPVPFVRVSLR